MSDYAEAMSDYAVTLVVESDYVHVMTLMKIFEPRTYEYLNREHMSSRVTEFVVKI